eukprot:XP_001201266.1 PREDICTED: histamine H3 receptor-like [Strongylocentrotus purpuratus]
METTSDLFTSTTTSPTTLTSVAVIHAFSSWTDFLIAAIGVVVITVTVAGNSLVIVSYLQDNHIRRVAGNQFILNLSIADLLVGLVSLPLYLQNLLLKRWVLGDIFCKLYTTFDYCVVSVSVLTVIYISLDRYWIVMKKLEYKSFLTKRRSQIMIVAAWLVVVPVISTLMLSWSSIHGESELYVLGTCTAQIIHSLLGSLIILVLLIVTPSAVILFLNTSVFIRICIQDRRFGRNNKNKYMSKKQASRLQGAFDDGIKDGDIVNRGGAPLYIDGLGIRRSTSYKISHENNLVQSKGHTSYFDRDNANGQTGMVVNATNKRAFAESELVADEIGRSSQLRSDISAAPSAVEQEDSNILAKPVRCHSSDVSKTVQSVNGVCYSKSFSGLQDICCNFCANCNKTPQPQDIKDRERRCSVISKRVEKMMVQQELTVHFRVHQTRELSRELSRTQHAAFMLSSLLLAFVVCWTPFAVSRVYGAFCGGNCLNALTKDSTEILVWLNSTINPVIYAFTNPRFRKNFIRLLSVKGCCRGSQNDATGSRRANVSTNRS